MQKNYKRPGKETFFSEAFAFNAQPVDDKYLSRCFTHYPDLD